MILIVSSKKILRQILEHLQKLIGRVPRLGKYQKQWQTLARLRKLETQTKKEILTMPLHYEIETDGLYLEGMEIGIEKGIHLGANETLRQLIIRMLQLGEFSKEKIAFLTGVDVADVHEIERRHLDGPQD